MQPLAAPFNCVFTLIPIHFLRQPDRWVPAKPQRKGGHWPFFQRRINAGTDTFIAVSRPVGAGETATKGRPMAVFSEAHQRRYRYIYCGIPTGGCRRNRNERAANGRFFRGASTPVLIHLLRQPDRWVQAKPQRKGGQWPFFQRRINAGTDTVIASARPVGAGKTDTY